MDTPTWFQQLLFRPMPNAGEDELTWLFRLARANGFRSGAALLSSAKLKIASHITPISSDLNTAMWAATAIDVAVGELLNSLYDTVGTALGVLVHHQGPQRWRLSRGDSTASMVRYAVCPTCLRTDEAPYYRSAWRYAAHTRCSIHGTALLERCRRCSADIAISTRTHHELVCCRECGDQLSSPMGHAPNLYVVSRNGLPLPGMVDERELPRTVASEHLYWDGIWVLLSHLLLRSTLKKLETLTSIPLEHRRALHRIAMSETATRTIRFESLGIDDREPLLVFVKWLSANWPGRFVGVFSAAGLHWSTLSMRQIEPPYWISEIFRWHLQRSLYRPSREEAEAARNALESESGRASRNRVKRLLGVTESSWVSEAVAVYSRTFSQLDLRRLLEDLAGWVESAPTARKQRASRVRDAAAIALCAVSRFNFTQVCSLLAADVELLHEKLLASGGWQLNSLAFADRWLSEYRKDHRPEFAESGGLQAPYFFVTRFGVKYEGYGLPAVLSGTLRRIGFPDTWRGVSVFEDLHDATRKTCRGFVTYQRGAHESTDCKCSEPKRGGMDGKRRTEVSL